MDSIQYESLVGQDMTVHLKSGQIVEGTLAKVENEHFIMTDGAVYTPQYKTSSEFLVVSRTEIIVVLACKGTIRRAYEN